ncbi:unnamed protein product [Durusdinium trenchii]|uniref:Uncharacterized protein n=1 Tax=Durusdinium trenchii TaxID=1381693 RepID=A0ABP0Q0H4_9DINO
MFIDWGKHAAENYRVMLLEEMHANANCCQLCTIFPRMAAFGSNLVDHRGAMAEALPNPKPTALSGPELLKDASWFDANWPLISTLLCPVAFVLPFVLCQLPGRAAIRHPYVLGWLTIAFYLCHQTEEHGYDLRGWRYAFVPDFNHGTGAWLFKECEKIGHRTCPADPRMATYINVVTVWGGFTFCMLCAHHLGGRYAYAGFCNWGMSVINALTGHLIPWMLVGYNPGAFQSIFMCLFGIYALSRVGKFFAWTCIVHGLAFHGVPLAVAKLFAPDAPKES